MIPVCLRYDTGRSAVRYLNVCGTIPLCLRCYTATMPLCLLYDAGMSAVRYRYVCDTIPLCLWYNICMFAIRYRYVCGTILIHGPECVMAESSESRSVTICGVF